MTHAKDEMKHRFLRAMTRSQDHEGTSGRYDMPQVSWHLTSYKNSNVISENYTKNMTKQECPSHIGVLQQEEDDRHGLLKGNKEKEETETV